jgi:exopolysaccharide biosynthesis polyprenyl glycosylphosphotransferase
MSTITRIGGPEPFALAGVGVTAAPGAEELREIVDPRTRALIQRGTRARRRRLVRRSLGLADIVGLSLAFLAASLLFGHRGASEPELLLFLASLPGWLLVAQLHGLYARDERNADHPTTDDAVGVFHLITIGTWLLLAGSLLSGLAMPEVSRLITFWALAICILPLGRTLARAYCRRRSAFVQNTLILGAGDVGQLIARKLLKHPEYGLNVVGFVDGRPKVRRDDLPEHLTVLGPPERLREIIEALGVERVVLSFSNDSATDVLATARTLHDLGVQLDIVPRLFDLVCPNVSIHSVEGLPLVSLPPRRPSGTAQAVKRTIDIAGASVMLLVTVPLFAFAAWRVWRDSPGPVFFRQTRYGCERREFTALKFRTMRVDTDTSVHEDYIRRTMSAGSSAGANGIYKLDRGDAVTASGRWLRKTSLDELPQLLNVLKGDMSLVGPRPCIPYEVEHFKPHQLERFLVPQGLTGLWQVTARANSSFGEALDMDVAYVRGWSLGLDLQLIARTPLQLLRQRKATA